MVDHTAKAREIMRNLDFNEMRKFHKFMQPHLTDEDIGTDYDIVCAMHLTRTQLDVFEFKYRAYSHRWLIEHDLPSALPNELRAKAEQHDPKVVEGVGIMIEVSSPELAPAALLVRCEMEKVVLEAYADSPSPHPMRLRERMAEARRKELRGLMLPDLAKEN